MSHFSFKTKDGATTFGNIMPDVENVSFRDFSIDFHAKSIYPAICKFMENILGYCIPHVVEKYAIAMATDTVESLRSERIPISIATVLTDHSLKKKQQVSLLKGVEISPTQLGAIFLFAESHGYKFSNYRFEGEPKQYSFKELPSFVYIKEDEVEHIGETELTDGQLKNIVENSNFIVARILDDGEHWHSFFQTRRGVLGNEPGENGRVPHLHYISDAFGCSLEDFKKAIKNGTYPSTKIHIPLLDHKPDV